jgi:adenylate cyclase
MSRNRLTAKLLPTLLGIITTLLFAWAQFSDVPLLRALKQRAESMAYDLRLNAGLARKPGVDPRIVIIDVDEKSLGAEGRWPWPRDKIAALTDRLFEGGAVVVGFDMIFSEPERNKAAAVLAQVQRQSGNNSEVIHNLQALVPEFDNDRRLAESLQDRDVTLGYLFHEEKSAPAGELPPPLMTLTPEQAHRSGIKSMPNYSASVPLLQEAAAANGFVTTWPDPDGIIRRTPMLIRHGDKVYGSLSLNLAKLYLFLQDVEIKTAPIGKIEAVEKIILGGTTIPTDGLGFALVPYRGPAGQFPYISATDILHGDFDPNKLEGAIVLVGATAVGISDLVATPVENIYPGVEVHANMVRGILDNDFPYEPAWADGANLLATLGIGLVLALLLPHLAPLALLLTSLLTAAGVGYGNFWLWQQQGLALALAWPMMLIMTLAAVNISYGLISETRKRAQLKNMFGQYVPPQLVDTMSQTSEESFGFEGESREMTVLFADIRDFTSLSEKLSPEALRNLLNRYFTHMTEIIFDHHGTIDKYVGDMIMAFWGAPLADADHARHALLTALQMLEKTAALKPALKAEGYPEIDIGIGLNSGLMNVGDMGSSYRRAYTVLGDNVNLGSRIEGLTKFYGVGLVVSETTAAGQDDILFRQLDRVKVKGRSTAVDVYQPLGIKEAINAERLVELTQHQQALAAYFQQDWDQARETFTQLQQQHPARLYQLYLERIEQLRQRNPGPEWDGVYERREK